MEKRLVLAIALSFIFVTLWASLTGKTKYPTNPQTFPQKTAIVEKSSPPKAGELVLKTSPENSQASFEFKAGDRKFIFNEPQATIKEVIFSKYQTYKFSIINAFLIDDSGQSFIRQPVENSTVTYVYIDEKKRITKQFEFSDTGYSFIFSLKIENLANSWLDFTVPILLGTIDTSQAQDATSFHGLTVWQDEKPLYPPFQKPATFNHLKFLSLRDKYFCAIIEPENTGKSGFVKTPSKKESEIGIVIPDLKIVPRGTWEEKFRVYIGPQDAKILKSLNPDWQAIIYFGKLDLIAQALTMLLEIFNNIFNNWGWSIILLSVIIYLVLYPLTAKQMKSMKEMQALQPKVEELRQLYKNDPKKLNAATMELYREHKVNPLGGCLPMLLQIPIFMALYNVLTRSIALKGAGIFWIKDLSEPDRLYHFSQPLPFIGSDFNILPILMSVEMFIQQKFSMVQTSPAQAEQQKIMMIIMPIIFGFIFYRMPSGLVLYWFINSSFTMVYQLRVARENERTN